VTALATNTLMLLAQVLSTLRKLKWLDIRSTVVEDLASAAIASLPSLESLNTR